MKNLILSILTVFVYCNIWAQCPQGDIELNTQEDIDNFVTNYPGCTELLGNLTIDYKYTDSINNLNGLANITSIGGNFSLKTGFSLTNLAGLENLTTVNGTFSLFYSGLSTLTYLENLTTVGSLSLHAVYGLKDLTGLESLNKIHNSLRINTNYSLEDISALSNVESIGSHIVIRNNSQLKSLHGLENVDSLTWSLEIVENDSLKTLMGLDNLSSIGGHMKIEDNRSLINLTGLEKLNTINRHCWITSNYTLTELTGLNNLNSIGGSFELRSVRSTTLAGLENLNTIGQSFIVKGNAFKSFEGLENLNSIGKHLDIRENRLQSLTGLENISSLSGNLILFNNNLTTLTGLDNLNSVRALSIYGNNNLSTLTALENLDSVYGNFVIGSNNTLTTLQGLENINHISANINIENNSRLSVCHTQSICDYLSAGGMATIQNNASGCNSQAEVQAACTPTSTCPSDNVTLSTQSDIDNFPVLYPDCTEIDNLTIGDANNANSNINNLDGLANISTITGNLTIIGNPNLMALEGLSSLASIGGDLDIRNNDDLFDLAGLQNITTINGNLYLVNNDVQLLGLNNLTSISGDLEIKDNHDLMGLPGLESLASVGGTLSIINNDALRSLAELESLTNIGNLIIQDNLSLSVCHEPSICDYLSAGGMATIQNNASGCNSQAEVQAACAPTTTCPSGNVTLSTQSDIDNFPILYPNCTEIAGDLFIGGTPSVPSTLTDLSPLSQLTSIQGKLTIAKNDALTNLSGLENLTTIDGDIYIGFNPVLSNLANWTNLTSTGGSIIIRHNALTDLTGFNSLASIGRYLNIGPSSTLTSLTGLENLMSINGFIYVQNNTALNSLNGLDNIDYTTITNLKILNNSQLNICNVQSICSYLENSGTATVSNNATDCNSSSEITNTCNPSSVCPSGNVTLRTQNDIDNFPILYPNCTEISGDLFIGGTPDVPSILTDLSPLSQLTSIQGKLTIAKNDALVSLSGLDNLAIIDGDIYIGFNPVLSSLANWNNLTSTGGSIIIRHNALTDLTGFNNLTSIGGYLNIGPSATLTSLTGLDNLMSINGFIYVQNNAVLNSLTGLDNVDYTTITNLKVLNNPQLSICDVPSVCSYLENGGTATIGGNVNNCNSETEVIASCSNTPPPNPCDGTPQTDSLTHIFDNDLFIDGVGFANNPTVTFTDSGTPADAVLSNISLELYFRLNGASCENEIALQITDPAGNTQPLNAYTTCNGGTGLYYVNLNVPSGNTTGSIADWIVEFNDTNDQNSGYEYSVRFARLNYVTTTSGGGSSTPVTNQISEIADSDLLIEAAGFTNNPAYTFTDPGTPADAVLSNISLELYFRLNHNSCEDDIAIQITDPAGNTHPLTAYDTCNGGTGLFYVNLDVPSGNTIGSIANWVVRFDDTKNHNFGHEYSVRFGRLTYDAEYTECPDVPTPQHLNTSTQKNFNTSTLQHLNTLKLYPVPANNLLNVEYFSENISSANIEIHSTEGKVVMYQKAALQEGLNAIQMNISDLSIGHYYIRMYSADDVQVQAFIKIAP